MEAFESIRDPKSVDTQLESCFGSWLNSVLKIDGTEDKGEVGALSTGKYLFRNIEILVNAVTCICLDAVCHLVVVAEKAAKGEKGGKEDVPPGQCRKTVPQALLRTETAGQTETGHLGSLQVCWLPRNTLEAGRCGPKRENCNSPRQSHRFRCW